MIDFRSDNTHGASPEIVEALSRANQGQDTSYGDDAITARVRALCAAMFETEVEIFPVVSGTAGNALALAAMTPSTGTILCSDEAHILRDELGAAELFTGGATLVNVAGANGKLPLSAVRDASVLSVTQATESGTVYSLDELRALGDFARSSGLGLHMDGARFANALATLGCPPADVTWRIGVDILTFGATKNGAFAAELLVVFRRELAAQLAPHWHRSGHRLSKTRFLSAQLEAYLTDDLWLRNARHANACARRLAERVSGIDGIEILRPVEANVVFLRVTPEQEEALAAAGVLVYDWPLFGPGAIRAVAGFGTTEEDLDAFVRAVSP